MIIGKLKKLAFLLKKYQKAIDISPNE